MIDFIKLKDLDCPLLRSLTILIITCMFLFGPILMYWCYYNAIQGSIRCIIISIIQIIWQIIASKSQLCIDLQKWSDQNLRRTNLTFLSETEIKDNEKCLFGVHPYSIFSFGMLINNHRGNFGKKSVACVSIIILLIPIIGLLVKLGGV